MEALKQELTTLRGEMAALCDRVALIEPFAREAEAKKKKGVLNREARRRQVVAREAAVSAKLKNLDCCCLVPKGKGAQFGRDPRLDEFIPGWAAKCVEFGKKNKPELFLEWLAWKWNCDTYRAKPLTKSQGYYHKFYGWVSSSDPKKPKPMRQKMSGKALFGKCAIKTFTTQSALEFAEAQWWSWGSRVLNYVRTHVEDELEAWGELPPHFRKVVGMQCGGHGMVQLRADLVWDPNEGPRLLTKSYPLAYNLLVAGWTAIAKGLRDSAEPT